jgi:sugar O-acyltransferase (sialic acid O-acetyltransferase NeuD family)
MQTTPDKPVALIGYSGHAYVVADALLRAGGKLAGYFDREEKDKNPFGLAYLGPESAPEAKNILQSTDYFVAIGDNPLRRRISLTLAQVTGRSAASVIHPSAVISPSVIVSTGVLIAANATLNPLVTVGEGAICNTSCSIDHECRIGAYAHIGPGAVLSGNVTVGENSFIGANAVIRQGVRIGNNVIVGAGCVVLNDIDDGAIVVGNPQRNIRQA